MDFKKLRKRMIGEQLKPRGISDNILDVFEKVPRHEFVEKKSLDRAYSDFALPIGAYQTISQPYMVARMTDLLDLKGDEKILEIGTGSGYQAAILAELGCEVTSIERYEELAVKARDTLKRLHYDVKVVQADGTIGFKQSAPYDAIIVTAGAPDVPGPLLKQLADGGRIVIPVGGKTGQQLLKVTKQGNDFTEEAFDYCTFVPLLGEHGWH